MNPANKPIIAALQGQAQTPPPIWLMRQAGRHLAEYRALRAEAGGFMNLVLDPEKAAEVTLQPVRRYDMDGSILFSDILVIPWALGQDLWFKTGEGPKLGPRPSTLIYDAQKLNPIFETLQRLQQALAGSKVTQLGFVGAPWTVATYMIEQGKPKFDKSRAFLDSDQAEPLFRHIIDATISYAKAQIAAGAEVIKIFDSWAGQLDEQALQRWSILPMVEIGAALAPNPVIYFPRNAPKALKYLKNEISGSFGYALGETADIGEARKIAGPDICLQGNLSPHMLLGPEGEQTRQVADLLEIIEGTPHIVNLGHGVDKTTDPARVQALVDQVRAG